MGVRLERPCADRLELTTRFVVRLQIQHVAGDDAEEQIVAVEPDPAEHRPSSDAAELLELVEYKRTEALAHGKRCESIALRACAFHDVKVCIGRLSAFVLRTRRPKYNTSRIHED